ncbi:metal-dependent hydrolase family protein [Truepera radiovictrix]|uniref:Amidohydrolase n=1 Tax=Truepera radiovictrix (strain DSM 17093 / CIP 108686 / LMG 22925 / RQ-24) TaxID=649638 RepID=D7CQ55_TRURR|nr:amidohydrolase family protein [Truepera radiovictrix]ADI14839.1 amidohydrolase [Truepera radiovictrix DSM 17093]WMT56610.1 amidohydrolase family protein [Truepera radiovictrix]
MTTFFGTFLFPDTGERVRGRLHTRAGCIAGFDAAEAQPGDTHLPGTVTPGLIDAHVHVLLDGGSDPIGTLQRAGLVERVLHAQRHLQQQLRAGVTTVRDLGGPDGVALALSRAVAAGELRGPHIVSSGRNITMTGGHGHALGVEADGEAAVRAAARCELKAGAQVLKFMATGGVLTPGVRAGAEAFTVAELRAGVEEAHKAGKRTAAHAQGLAGIKNALHAGVDTVEHGAFDAWDDEALELLLDASHPRWLVPTLAAPAGILAGKGALPAWMVEKTEPIAERHRANTATAHRAGVRVAAGTDAGTPFNPHGNLPLELELLAQVGLSPLAVLRAATVVAADALDLAGEVGTLQPGAWADLVAWDGDPLADVRVFRRPRAVIVRGAALTNA